MASKTLTARVRLNTTDAEAKIKRLVNQINQIDRTLSNTGKGSSSEITKKMKETTSQTQQWAEAVKQVNNKLNNSKSLVKSIGSALKQLASRYLGVMGLKTAINASDTLTSAQNKINYVTSQNMGTSGTNADGTYSTAVYEETDEALGKMYTSSQKVRMSYGDMMSNVSKSMVLCGDAFDNNTDKAIRFQEIMAEAYAVGGATAQEMSTSMYQLIQGLSGNLLAGDELRSVREGAPLAYKEIEKLAQKLYDTDESLKDIASDGKITADIVVQAILGAGEKMDKAFKQTEQTFAQTWTQIKNIALRAFTPLSKELTKKLNEAIDNGLIKRLEEVFVNIAKGIMVAFNIIERVIKWVANNWSWIQHIIVGGLILMITWTLIKAGIAIACTILEIKALLQLAGVQKTVMGQLIAKIAIIAVIIVAVMALIYVFILWKTGAINTCQAIVAALIIVGIAIAIIGLITHSTVLLIIGIVIAAIGLIVNWLDYFLAIVYSVSAVIWNIIVGFVNGIIQFIWTGFVQPFIQIIEWVLNVCNGGFNSFGDAVANLIGNIIGWFLSLGQVVTKIIDAIFGTNWTSGLESLKSKVISWGKNENAITLNREAPTLLNRVSYTDAWNLGMDYGTTAKNWLKGLGSQYQGGFGGGFDVNNLANSLGVDTSAFDNLFDDRGLDYVLGDTGDIADNTGKVAKSMELAEEDLEYLRRLAELEWKKEYTTAEIKVDMSNYNNINGESDLDGIVTKLSEKLYEEMNVVANGVYV